MCVTGQSTI